MWRITFLFPILMAACVATPPCPGTGDLTSLDRRIAKIERDLARGYVDGLGRRDVLVSGLCTNRAIGAPYVCLERDRVFVRTRRPVDRAAAGAELAGLRAERSALVQEIASCRALRG